MPESLRKPHGVVWLTLTGAKIYLLMKGDYPPDRLSICSITTIYIQLKYRV